MICAGLFTGGEANADSSAYSQPGFTFALDMGRASFDFDDDGNEYPATNNTLGISAYQYGTSNLALGFEAGYSHFTIRDNPLTEGAKLSGYYFGLGLRNHEDNGLFEPVYGLRYRYHSADESVDDQDLSLEIHDWWAWLGGRFRIAPQWDVFASLAYGGMAAELLARGTVRATEELDFTASQWVHAGIRWRVERSGYVLLSGTGGNLRSVELSFRHDFY